MNMLKCINYSPDQVNEPAVNLGGNFIVKLVSTTGQIESTATAYHVSSGVNITCNNDVSDQTYSNTRSITIGEN